MALFVGRLNSRIHKQDLEEKFEKYGRLTRCDLKPQGYAFITYEDFRDAEDAMRELQGQEITGCRINIEWSKESGRYDRNTFFRCDSNSPKNIDDHHHSSHIGHHHHHRHHHSSSHTHRDRYSSRSISRGRTRNRERTRKRDRRQYSSSPSSLSSSSISSISRSRSRSIIYSKSGSRSRSRSR